MNFIVSVFKYKCPQCRKGDLFVEPFRFSDPLNMYEECSICGQKTSPEPGFYYGAMFVSYIITGFLYLGIIGFCIIKLGLSVNQSFVVLLIFVGITYFKTARLARSFWIHFIVDYKPGAISEKKQ
jgi:uncharacterized protein (DUF983 family)